MPDPIFGEITGHPLGTTYVSRSDLAAKRVHPPLQDGTCGDPDGAESIVVSGGYVDDLDYGDEIVYTGQGGRARTGAIAPTDPSTDRQDGDLITFPGYARHGYCSRIEPAPVTIVIASARARLKRGPVSNDRRHA